MRGRSTMVQRFQKAKPAGSHQADLQRTEIESQTLGCSHGIWLKSENVFAFVKEFVFVLCHQLTTNWSRWSNFFRKYPSGWNYLSVVLLGNVFVFNVDLYFWICIKSFEDQCVWKHPSSWLIRRLVKLSQNFFYFFSRVETADSGWTPSNTSTILIKQRN